jgi:subfamily B ATP-binding cassette protein MsbA
VWLSNRITANLRSQVLKVLLWVGIDFHNKSKSGELLEKTVNQTEFLRLLFNALMEFVVFFSMTIILIALMFVISWQLSLITIILGSIFIGILSLYMRRLPGLGEQVSKTQLELTNSVQENLNAVHLIQSYHRQQHQLDRLLFNIENHRTQNTRLSWRLAWINPITEGLGAIAMGILLVGSWSIMPPDARISLAMLLPFLYILLRNVHNFRLLYNLRGIILAHWPYLKMIHDLLREDNKPFINDGKNEFPGLEQEIVFDSVSFSYDQKLVLNDVNFSIPRSKITAIVGMSGAGKSTVVNLLLRLYDPQEGQVRMDAQPLTDFRLASYRRKIGIVSQDTFIFNQSVRENIGFAIDEKNIPESRIIDAAKRAGAHDFIMELPQGYNTLLGDRGVMLSGGQRQRISIARAILKDPEILILDEATSSLDTITEQSVHQAILALQKERTVIIIAHRLSTIKNADKVIVLKEGRVVEAGPPQLLLEKGEEYYKLMLAG